MSGQPKDTNRRKDDEENPKLPATEEDPLLESFRRVPPGTIASSAASAFSKGHRKVVSLFAGQPRQPGQVRRKHHRHKSSLTQLMETPPLDAIGEGMQAEGKLLRSSWKQELEDAGKGRAFFLDMSMTRSLSVLPESIGELVQEATGLEVEPEAPEDASAIGRYTALLGAVFAVSSNGTALALLHGVPPPLKLYWRMTCTALCLSAVAVPQIVRHGWPQDMNSMAKCLTLAAASAGYAMHTLCFVYALQYTSIGNAVIGANSQAMLLILGKMVVGERVVLLEGVGVLVAFAGCLLCAQDEARLKGGEAAEGRSEWDNVMGDLIAFSSGAFGVVYLTFAKAIRPYMPVTVFMACVMFFGSFLIIPFCYISQDPDHPMTWDNDSDHGFFGWMNMDQYRMLIILHIALVCNICGTMGFYRAMQFFDTTIIAVATLLEPLIATVIAFVVGVGLLPGTLGWAGNFIVVLGTFCVVYPSASKGQSDH